MEERKVEREWLGRRRDLMRRVALGLAVERRGRGRGTRVEEGGDGGGERAELGYETCSPRWRAVRAGRSSPGVAGRGGRDDVS